MMKKPKKLKIAFISYSLSGGGAERNIINLDAALKKKGLASNILLFKYIVNYKINKKNHTIFYIFKAAKKMSILELPIKILQLIFRFLEIITQNKYNILVGALAYHPYYIAVFFGKLLQIRSVCVVNNNILEELREKKLTYRLFHIFLLKLSFYFCDAIVCVSKGVSEELINEFGVNKAKVEVIYNGIDIKNIQKKSKDELQNSIKTIVNKSEFIITAGRLEKQKNHDILLKTFHHMKKVHKKIKLIILGSGRLQQHLQNLSYKLDLEKNILFLGFQQNPFSFFSRAKIFVLTSSYEGFGNVIIEAMACGLPIVSVDCRYGPREILSKNPIPYDNPIPQKITFSDYGILVKSVKELNDIIPLLLNDNKIIKYYKKKSLKRAEDFSLQKMSSQYWKLFQQIG